MAQNNINNNSSFEEEENETEDSKAKPGSPLFIPKYLLPTGKPHISYSEMSNHIECSWRHKLQYIDKIVTENDGPSIHTEFGQVIHNALEHYIVLKKEERCPINPGPVEADFRARCEALRASGVEVTEKDEKDFLSSVPPILTAVPVWLDTTFPGWIGIEAEKQLYEPIPGQTKLDEEVFFKGFIDACIKVPKYKKKKSKKAKALKKGSVRLSALTEEDMDLIPIEGQWEYFILDWKTCGAGWTPDKKRDFNKQLQIILYKHFFCEVMKLDLKEVKCGFVLLKRKPGRRSPCELIPISVGPVAQERALTVLNQTINQIKRGIYLKDKRNCKYCPYFNTPHCK